MRSFRAANCLKSARRIFMAEERLVDDDKDRKYKIRKNADGEDELVIDAAPEEEDRKSVV